MLPTSASECVGLVWSTVLRTVLMLMSRRSVIACMVSLIAATRWPVGALHAAGVPDSEGHADVIEASQTTPSLTRPTNESFTQGGQVRPWPDTTSGAGLTPESMVGGPSTQGFAPPSTVAKRIFGAIKPT